MVDIAMVAGQDPSTSLRGPSVDGICLDTAIVISHGRIEEAFREQRIRERAKNTPTPALLRHARVLAIRCF